MKYTEKEFLDALGVDSIHECFFEKYEESMAEYDGKGAFFLADVFVSELICEWKFLNKKKEFVMQELRRVRECDLAARYSFLLYKMLLRNTGKTIIELEQCPSFEDISRTVDFEMAAYFALLAFAPKIIESHKNRGLPDSIITDTLADCFEDTIELRNLTHGRDGFDDKTYFAWNQLYTECHIIRIGVLNFEMNHKFPDYVKVFKNSSGEYAMLSLNREISEGGFIAGTAGHPDIAFISEYSETEDEYVGYSVDMANARVRGNKLSLKKSEWKPVLSEGDGAVSVHIPTGAVITRENCTAAYRECFEIARKYYPEYNIKSLFCHSWLLDPAIEEVTKKKSNIVNFGSQYLRYPTKSAGRAVFTFLFRRQVERLEDLPETTSLMRAVKERYLSGKYVYEISGIIFRDMLG